MFRRVETAFRSDGANAIAYFNPSSEIKFTDKRTIHGKVRLPKYRREFREFLERNVIQAYVR